MEALILLAVESLQPYQADQISACTSGIRPLRLRDSLDVTET